MLEPFGLLNFIQSALKSSQANPSDPPRNTTDPAEPTITEPTSEPTPPPTTAEPPWQENPFLDFCKLHDERAKRIKKDKK